MAAPVTDRRHPLHHSQERLHANDIAHDPRYKPSFIPAFVTYRETVTVTTHVSIKTGYRFSASARARPQTNDPVRALFKRTLEHRAGAMLFEQTTYQVTTTVLVQYFGFACHQSLASAQRPGAPCLTPMTEQMPRQVMARNAPAASAAPSFEPVPRASNVAVPAPVAPASAPALEQPVATASLKPIEPSKRSDPFDWEKRSVEEMRYRYDIWNALGQQRLPRVEVSSKASPRESKTVTPRGIDAKGLSFSAEDANGNLEKIPFSDVSRLRVLSA